MTDLSAVPQPGDPVDLAPFARLRWWSGSEGHDLQAHDLPAPPGAPLYAVRGDEPGAWQIGLEWDAPRDVRRVVVCYAGERGPETPARMEYWQRHWPTPAPERLPGARRGWIGRDDPWHGRWVRARGGRSVEGSRATHTFDPIDLPELGGDPARLEEAADYLVRFRRTLKLRLLWRGDEPPPVAALHVYGDHTWQHGVVEAHLDGPGDWSGRGEVHDGCLLGVEGTAGAEVGKEGRSWRCVEGEAPVVLRIGLLHAVGPGGGDGVRTAITLHTAAHSFTVTPDELDRGPVWLPAYGAYLTWAGGPSPAAYREQIAGLPRSIVDRVEGEPEASLSRALAEIPPLDVTKQEAPVGRYLPLGLEAGRQEFALRHNGELFADKGWLKLSGRDAARLIWPGRRIRYRFGTGDPPDFRERGGATAQSLRDGWLPVVTSRWLDREIEVEQTAFVAPLSGEMAPPHMRRGDEDVAAMLRFRLRNTTPGTKRAVLWIVVAPQEALEVRGEQVVALGRVVPAAPVARQWRVQPYESPCLRCLVRVGGRGRLEACAYAEGEGARSVPTALRYEVELSGGEAHTVDVTAPFCGLEDEADRARAAALDWDEMLGRVAVYWAGWVQGGGQMDLPERVLADFHRAARTHVAITADVDPASGLIVVPAATLRYGACGNEACWQIAMLDQAGHHDRAEACLEVFLRTQGALRPDGRFGSAEGAFQAANLDEGAPVGSGFGYNLDHGVILECLAEHYFLSGDRAWLARAAPHLVAACRFVIRERGRTRRTGPDGERDPAWGLLPAGHLEDNPEWRHWFAVNAHAYHGMRAAAAALAEIDHPEAEALAGEAAAYREDIRRAARRATVGSPVVRLLDGTCVPHVPTRAGIRGREWGWFREAAYGALHLLEGNVLDPGEPEVDWILRDLEDNLYPSREWGRPVDLERSWFSHGGITIQPNLTDLGIDYLRRGQVKHALRALYNNFGVSLYRDLPVFAEHPVVELGHGVGPFYKSSDEAKALIWLRAFLVREEGEALHLAPGAPRAWFAPGQAFGVRDMATHFGPLTYRIESDESGVTARIDLRARRTPRPLVVHLRLPEGRMLGAVEVQGAEAEVDREAGVAALRGVQGPISLRAGTP